MRNRFNLNEEEKKHIRGLHGINILSEQTTSSPDGDDYKKESETMKIEDISFNRLDEVGTKAWDVLGNVHVDFRMPNEFKFIGPDGKKWAVSKEWVWQELNVDDQPKFAAEPNGKPTNEFRNAFDNRQELN